MTAPYRSPGSGYTPMAADSPYQYGQPGLEPTPQPHAYPEVADQPRLDYTQQLQQPQLQQQHVQQPQRQQMDQYYEQQSYHDPVAVEMTTKLGAATYIRPDSSYNPVALSTLGTNAAPSFNSQEPLPMPARTKPTTAKICGCAPIVFILSCIIALLSVAVVGLAAGTGIESNRANEAASKLAALSASGGDTGGTTATVTVTATPTSTSDPSPGASEGAAAVSIDEGCGADPTSQNGTVFTTYEHLGKLRFRKYCHMDLDARNLLSLFTSGFGTCMDACAAYSTYASGFADREDDESNTCRGVSFVPHWTNVTAAKNARAKGNCYLKGGRVNETSLAMPNGRECHSGVYLPG